MVGALHQTVLASTVVYTPFGGAPQSIKAFVDAVEPDADLGRSRTRRESIRVEVLRTAIAEPAEGATILHEGRTFKVMSRPEIADPDRLLWRLEAHEVIA